MADEAKAKGNAAFSSGNFNEAITHFTTAISLSPENHVLYSNRSAAYASLNDYSNALNDAKKTIDLKPDWPKGYSRLGAAYLGLKNKGEAVKAYSKGLEVDPNNEALKCGLEEAKRGENGAGFGGPEMWARLSNDPVTRMYLQEPDFVEMMKDIQKNPNKLNMYMKDERVMQALGVLLNIKMHGKDTDFGFKEGKSERKRPAPQHKQNEAEAEAEAMEEEVSEQEKEKRERKAEAQKEKEAGNVAYKKKDFDTAIERYSKAIELDDEDISFITNRAAVYLEMGKFEECIKDCDKAVERGRELRSDFKMIAKALTRKGTALVKMAKCSKDFDPAIEAFQKALTEHRNPDTLKRLNEAEKAKKELVQQEYFDPQLADEEREKGNGFFKEQKYPDAIKHYTEALKRNPKDVKAYSNRAASYTKLGAMPEGLKDAEKCIEIDPTFVKGYSRKGAVQFFMKEYQKALETYQDGLKHEPQNQELLDGVKRCVQQINKGTRGDLTPEELKERQARAMQDPEIQKILTDPVMGQVLSDFQENPKAAQEHVKNPEVMSKLQKLINAGIVQMK